MTPVVDHINEPAAPRHSRTSQRRSRLPPPSIRPTAKVLDPIVKLMDDESISRALVPVGRR